MSKGDAVSYSLETLRAIRAEVHGKVEASVIERLDAVIQELEASRREDPGKYTAGDILTLVGEIVQLLPAVVELVDKLQGCR